MHSELVTIHSIDRLEHYTVTPKHAQLFSIEIIFQEFYVAPFHQLHELVIPHLQSVFILLTDMFRVSSCVCMQMYVETRRWNRVSSVTF